MFDRQVRPPSIWQRILLGLALALLVTLLGVLFVSVLYPGGPATLAERGEGALRAGRQHEAIALLDEAERNLQGPRETGLLERIYKARAQAHLQVGNLGFAERDLLAALDLPLAEESKHSLRISLARSVHLQRAGQLRAEGEFGRAEAEIELALRLVRDLARNGHSSLWLQASETAGEACQRYYQLIVARIQEELRIPLASQMLLEANRLLLELIFLPEQNPVSQILRERLEKIFMAGDLSLGRRTWVDQRIQDARGWVAESFRFYGQALGPPEAFAALQGITGLLDQTGRSDEAAMLSQIALDTWESPFLGRAAERLAEIHRQAGRPDRALRVLEEWRTAWPPDQLLRRFQAFPSQAQEAWVLGMDLLVVAQDGVGLTGWVEGLWPFQEHWTEDTGRLMHFFSGMQHVLRKWDPSRAEGSLARFARMTGARPTGWIDRYRLAQEARVELALQGTQAEAALGILTQWIEQRPWDVAARLRRAEVLVGLRKEDEALVDLQKAYSLEPTDAVLERLWAARSSLLERQGHTVPRLAASLLERDALSSQNLPNRHLHLGLARHLLAEAEAHANPVLREGALFQARLAALVYPESPAVQLLLARARLATGRSEEARAASSALETLRAREPENPELLRLLWLAGKALGRHDPKLDRELVRFGTGPEAFRLLARSLHGMTFWNQALAVASRGLAHFGASDPELNLLAGDACRRLRRSRDAAAFYTAVDPASPLFWEACKRRMEVLLEGLPGPALEQALSTYSRADAPIPETLETIELLLSRSRPADALRLASELAKNNDAARTGRLYLLAARALHATGKRKEALLEAEKALGFPDGQAATLFLVTTFLAEDRILDASEVLALCRNPELLPPLEMATLHALAGLPERAREFLDGTVSVPAEFWGQARRMAVQALLGRSLPGSAAKDSLAALIAGSPGATALTLHLLEAPGWGRDALAVARAHFQPDMENPHGRLLLARAHLAAGQVPEGVALLARLVARHPDLSEAWKLLFEQTARLIADQDLLTRTLLSFQLLLPLWQRRMSSVGTDPSPADLEFPSYMARLLADWGRFLGQGASSSRRPTQAERWLRFASHFTGLSLELLLRAHPDQAHDRTLEGLLLAGDLGRSWQTMASALDRAQGEQLARLSDGFFRVSQALPELSDRSRAIAERLLLHPEGPSGPALHYLLATDGVPPADAARRRIDPLRQHLRRVRQIPVATVDFLFAGSTARLLVHANPEEARSAALELLDRCPAHWGAWEALALAEEALGRVDAACQILAFPRRFLENPPTLVTETTLTARLDRPGLPSEEALASLDPERSALERMAASLWNLRQGREERSLELLGEWPGEEPAEVLFYRAAAAIFLRPPMHARAYRDLETLARRHAAHPLARYVDLVIKLLGPDPR